MMSNFKLFLPSRNHTTSGPGQDLCGSPRVKPCQTKLAKPGLTFVRGPNEGMTGPDNILINRGVARRNLIIFLRRVGVSAQTVRVIETSKGIDLFWAQTRRGKNVAKRVWLLGTSWRLERGRTIFNFEDSLRARDFVTSVWLNWHERRIWDWQTF